MFSPITVLVGDSDVAVLTPAAPQGVVNGTIGSTVVLRASTVSLGAAPSQSVAGALISSTVVLRAPTVGAGTVTITGATIASTAALNAPDTKLVNIVTEAIPAGSELFAPTVVLGAPSISAGGSIDIQFTLVGQMRLQWTRILPGI